MAHVQWERAVARAALPRTAVAGVGPEILHPVHLREAKDMHALARRLRPDVLQIRLRLLDVAGQPAKPPPRRSTASAGQRSLPIPVALPVYLSSNVD